MAADSSRLRGRWAAPKEDQAEPARLALDALVRALTDALSPSRATEEMRRSAAVGLVRSIEPIAHGLAQLERPASPSLVEALTKVIQASGDPIRAAFLARALNALAKLALELSDDALGASIGAPTEYSMLLRTLEDPATLSLLEVADRRAESRVLDRPVGEEVLEAQGDTLGPERADPLAEARVQGLRVREEVLTAEGGTVSSEQAGALLGISRQAVDKRRRAGRLLALPIGNHRYSYPGWQFTSTAVLHGLTEVLEELDIIDPWTRAAFFLSENTRLDGARPLDELRRGNVEAVRVAAWSYGRQGAA